MFKLIYTADLHGNEKFYKRLLEKAEDENVNAIAIGGDLCGREGSTIKEKVSSQKIFLEKFVLPLLKEFNKKNKNTEIYAIMGNDDFRENLDILENADKNKILKSIHKKSIKLNKSFSIAGYSFVNPTPFRLKDWEKPDFEGDGAPTQLFNEEIRSIGKENGTIQEDLNQLKQLSNPRCNINRRPCRQQGDKKFHGKRAAFAFIARAHTRKPEDERLVERQNWKYNLHKCRKQLSGRQAELRCC
ncbi:hypothetical protein J4204_01065 [Candidatus Woesearchaeota archaeon]|nr:hypothetical protein [Candidatus Woesearchaeota archaeon]